MPTRFKYIPVAQQNYSLDPIEILLADDKDLNEYMSVKKYAPYRQDKGDRSRWDPKQQEKLRTLRDNLKKRHIAFFGPQNGNDGGHDGGQQTGAEKKKKRKGKKERMKMKAETGEGGEEAAGDSTAVSPQNEAPMDTDQAAPVNRKRKAVEENLEGEQNAAATEDGRKKKKRRRRHGKKESAATEEG